MGCPALLVAIPRRAAARARKGETASAIDEAPGADALAMRGCQSDGEDWRLEYNVSGSDACFGHQKAPPAQCILGFYTHNVPRIKILLR
jgi:hypothetical protein